MDLLQLPSVLMSLSFLLLLILIIKRGYTTTTTTTNSSSSLNLPPGPSKLPIIGSLHHLLTDALPHHAFRRLAQEHGPVMLLKLGQVNLLVASSPEAACEIMKSQDLNFCSRPETHAAKIFSYEFKDIAFAPYGDYWRQLKKICVVELLSAKRVRSLHSIFEQEISNLMNEIMYTSSERKTINLSMMVLALINTIIARCAFGSIKSEHQEKFISSLKETFILISGFGVADLFPDIKYINVVTGTRSKVQRVYHLIDEILEFIVEEHQPKRVDQDVEDLVDVLLRIKDHSEQKIPLTRESIKGVILDVFAGGSQTSSTTIVWAMSELMKNPKTMEKATAEARRVMKGKTKIGDDDLGELHYVKMVIKETLRLHPPLPLLSPRQCMNSCQVDRYDIPVGTRVAVNLWAIGRNQLYWDDAESFKPERFSSSPIDFKGANFEFMPFGAGRRICPGITFGSTTVELTLVQLLFNFNWELPNGILPQELDMTEYFGMTAGRKTDLWLLATPYSPSANA